MKLILLKPNYFKGVVVTEGQTIETDEQHGRQLIKLKYARPVDDEGGEDAKAKAAAEAQAKAEAEAQAEVEAKAKAEEEAQAKAAAEAQAKAEAEAKEKAKK
ncbi:hypothetical protein HA45_09195 [Pantoea rodasii]|uniref:DUF7210 family protein n=1 Tax=Pantoea rodasii TaxID=1076549 RepID=UPI000A2416C8|nr:hypothetical protein [Pantoea rodasii]ORM64533.1 hypothetical protein HA45_09195 [Pantoea rodasii]